MTTKWATPTSYWFENDPTQSYCKALAEASKPFMSGTFNRVQKQARDAVVQTVSNFLFRSDINLGQKTDCLTFPMAPNPLTTPVILSGPNRFITV